MRTGTEYQKGSGYSRHVSRNRRETGHSRPRLAKAARHGAPRHAGHATSSLSASRKTFVCLSTSSASVCGHIKAMLWKGVSRMPRFMA